ncbi:43L [Yaba monkey tumor virus]|uniref:43L n=1 Tax=Yaba monkey tumor virus (strain VR587) TaxID=928314 RepID=Q6TUX0_YMTV5|nr:putative DNA-binding virion core protein [Yaba monkey tumor virus]AAR07399.1 43L [Yaba monkey tumor virus]
MEEQIVLNNISARALKTYFTSKISDIVDELVIKKYPQKKKSQVKKPETRIPVDLIKEDFVKKFKLENYSSGVLTSLINSLVENNYFSSDGKLTEDAKKELVITEVEKKILSSISPSSPLYIDISDVKTLSSRLKTSASSFFFKDCTYNLEPDKIEELINQLSKNKAILLDEKSSVKDSVYLLTNELLDVLKTRLFRCPQVKDNFISKTRLYDYFTRVTKHDDLKIYVILKDEKIADILGIETIKIGSFIYTKHSMLVNSISVHIDRYSKKFQETFYENIAEFVRDNEKINVSKVVECLIVPSILLDED